MLSYGALTIALGGLLLVVRVAEHSVFQMLSGGVSRLHLLGNAVGSLLMLSVLHETDLVASYVAVLLLVNVCTTTAVAIGMIYARRGQGLSHYYLGEGLLAILRCCLGTIEAASGLFRSVSLSLRTACNAVAGHVLLAVLIDMTLATCCTGSTTYRVHL